MSEIVEEQTHWFYTKTTQKGGFSKLEGVEIKKRCHTERQTYSIFQHVSIG
jgi:hypothetical protein